jgi:hypothetical protein
MDASPLAGRVFISYRRQESGHLGRLYLFLAARFGEEQVFIDVDKRQPGVDFADVIAAAVSACEVLVVVIGPQWANATDEHGQRRLDDPEDLVRLEIEAGLRRGVRVIPVLAEGATMPRRNELPSSLAGLVRRHVLPVRRHDHMARIWALIDARL